MSILYFNPRPSYEGRRHRLVEGKPHRLISIHAPHTRGDYAELPLAPRQWYFNPRPSYEGRHDDWESYNYNYLFQSTPLIRGATRYINTIYHCCTYFNPRPSYEGRHHLLGEHDRLVIFQSTPLIRGATGVEQRHRRHITISIHAPHTRGDSRVK